MVVRVADGTGAKGGAPAPGEPDLLERWSALAREFGFTDFLAPEDGFGACAGKRRRWANSRRAGIYFWLTSNGEAYIGQSVRPQARLRQHHKAHGDIVHAAFRRCPRAELDSLEADLVRRASDHFPLRNIKLAVSTASQVPFDFVVPPAEQAAFLAREDPPVGEWKTFEQLERLQERKFDRFMAHPLAGEALRSARLFLSRVIPKPAETEVAFWSVTIQPAQRLLRVNSGQQEVFTYEAFGGAGAVRIFSDARIGLLRSWRSPYQTPSFVTDLTPRSLDKWLAGKALLSCRRLAVQLMRHTQALNSASHCPQLVRRVFDLR